jgi:hypothetical protein
MITKETILANIDIMSSTIESFNGIDTTATIDFLSQIVSLQSTATETQASAKYHLLKEINSELDRQAKLLNNDKIAPSIKKMRADAMCAEWHYIYEKSVRLSSAISHTIEACRTKISYLKQEMENSKYQN